MIPLQKPGANKLFMMYLKTWALLVKQLTLLLRISTGLFGLAQTNCSVGMIQMKKYSDILPWRMALLEVVFSAVWKIARVISGLARSKGRQDIVRKMGVS